MNAAKKLELGIGAVIQRQIDPTPPVHFRELLLVEALDEISRGRKRDNPTELAREAIARWERTIPGDA